ncbi:MAG: hypothetical protein M1821_008381 [Bathelium mastoideum]|nr:MAG: hypothetical protein M1821_008381 [Bathelium mastoideum]
MDFYQETTDVQNVLNSNVLKVKAMISLPKIDETLIRQALTAAHRDDISGYHHDGNRDMLAPLGNTAITWCVRNAQKSHEYRAKYTVWKQLETSAGLLQVARNSPLNGCLMTSIRQNSSKSDNPWPARVAMYAVRGLIGAAVQSEGFDIKAISSVMDALSHYLDSERAERTDVEPPLTPPISLAQHTHQSSSESPSYFPDYAAEFMKEEDRTHILGTNLDLLNELYPPLQGDIPKDLNRASMLDIGVLDDLASQVQPLSLAHTCTEGRQAFEIVPSRPIGDLSPKRSTKTSTYKKTLRKSRTKSPVETYVSSQRQLAASSTGPASLYNQSYPDLHPSHFAGDKYGQMMTKLYHGLVSPFAVLHVRQALLVQEPATSTELPEGDSSRAVFHYRMIKEIHSSRSADTVRRLHHMYSLYTSLRNRWQTDKDEGFVHQEFQTFTPGSAKRRKGPGNPLLKDVARAFDDMLIAAEPQIRYKSQAQQRRLTSEIQKLQKIGERLFLLVKEFQLGILCLLFFHQSVEEAESIFAITEIEFSTVPIKNFDDFLRNARNSRHPLYDFSKAAESAYNVIVNASVSEGARFRCQDNDPAELVKMLGGSAQLCEQLRYH